MLERERFTKQDSNTLQDLLHCSLRLLEMDYLREAVELFMSERFCVYRSAHALPRLALAQILSLYFLNPQGPLYETLAT